MKKRTVLNSLILVTFVLALWVTPVFAYEPYFFLYHRVDSDLVNGKSSYSKAYFNRVYIDVATDQSPTSDTATLTVKNGSYSYGTWDGLWDDRPIERVFNADRTFDLKYYAEDDALAPINEEGDDLIFWGAADTGFSEREFTFTIDETTGEGKLPKIRSTSEQLSTYVPYIEYVLNKDNYITGLKVRFVNPSNLNQALTKGSAANVDTIKGILFWGADDRYFGTIFLSLTVKLGTSTIYGRIISANKKTSLD